MTKSICKKVCSYIENTNICIGCGRTSDEIEEWFYCDNDRKKEIIKQAKARKKVSNE